MLTDRQRKYYLLTVQSKKNPSVFAKKIGQRQENPLLEGLTFASI